MTQPTEEALLRDLKPEVQKLARRLARRSAAVAEEDFASAGNQEALLAVREFDATRDVPLRAFVMIRARWAMGRLARDDERQSGRRLARELIRGRLVTSPLEVPVDRTLDEAMASSAQPARDRMKAFVREELASLSFAILTAQPRPSDEAAHEAASEQRVVREALEDLSPQERWLVERIYKHDASLEVIAKELGVSSRTVKRHHQAIKASLAKSLSTRGVDRTHAE